MNAALFFHAERSKRMNYVLQCEDCKRPAQMISVTKAEKSTHTEVKKEYEKMCPCGGEIKPTLE